MSGLQVSLNQSMDWFLSGLISWWHYWEKVETLRVRPSWRKWVTGVYLRKVYLVPNGSASSSFHELSSSAAPIYHPLPTRLLFPGLNPLKLWGQTSASSFVFLSRGILPQRQQPQKQTSIFPNWHLYFLITQCSVLCIASTFSLYFLTVSLGICQRIVLWRAERAGWQH